MVLFLLSFVFVSFIGVYRFCWCLCFSSVCRVFIGFFIECLLRVCSVFDEFPLLFSCFQQFFDVSVILDCNSLHIAFSLVTYSFAQPLPCANVHLDGLHVEVMMQHILSL